MAVLYRKYRPQSFGDIAGQEHVKKTLSEEVASDRLAHSYLFTGPRGVGKTTTARVFAKAVNCGKRKKASGEPCGTCDSCVQITEGRSLDVVEIDAASHTGVDNVREQIIESSRFAPTEAPYKVFVIDEVHMLSTSAFNALLKTLEEPPAHVLFVLATTELHKLPATVVSRCQRFDFRKIPKDRLMERLTTLVKAEGVKVETDVLEAVSRHSEGCLRDAESLLTQILSMGEKKVTMETASLVLPTLSSDRVAELASAVLSRDIPASLSLWEGIATDGSDPHRIVADMIDLVRNLALSTMKGPDAPLDFPLSDERHEDLRSASAAMGPGDYAALLDALMRVREEMKRVELAELPFEMMVMAWAAPSRSEVVHVEPPKNEAPKEPPKASTKTGDAKTETPSPEAAPETPPAAAKAETTLPEPKPESTKNAMPDTDLLDGIRAKWQEIVEKSQEKNQGLPYMLGVGELVAVEGGKLKIGFQYALYRDRLNGKCKRMLEDVISEVMKGKVLVEGVLLEKKEEEASGDASQKLPDGFADLVNDFGGSMA